MTESGWVRLVPYYQPEAVAWWFFKRFDDGFCFARGGRVRSARQARKAIRQAHLEVSRDRQHWRTRPEYTLGTEGELVPLELAGTVEVRKERYRSGLENRRSGR